MSRYNLISDIAIFPNDGRNTVLIDRIEVRYMVRRCTAHPLQTQDALRSTTDLGLNYTVPLRHRHTQLGWEIRWTWAGVDYEYHVPKYRTNGMYSIWLTTVFNPLRMLRSELSRWERALHDAPPDAKTNMLDPRAVPPEVAHQRVIERVTTVVSQRMQEFIMATRSIFGVALTATDVITKAAQIELAWDRACDAANTAMHALAAAWLATIPRARKRYPLGTAERDPRVELWGDGVLKASFRKGWTLKLYALPGGALRYECQLTAASVRLILGRRLRLMAPDELRADLVRVAHRVYGPIVAVQHSLLPSSVPSVVQLLTALVPEGSAPLAMHTAEQLVAFGQVRCNRDTPSVYKTMRRMRARELMVKSAQPGYWVPTPSFALLLQGTVQKCLVLSGQSRNEPHARKRKLKPTST